MKPGKSSYYVRKYPQLNGTYAIHKEGCPFLPVIEKRIWLGEFSSFREAAVNAELFFSEVSYCCYCSGAYYKNENSLVYDFCTSFFMGIS